jgi:predicted NAD-dependent protein-ADP-ribosyltransferase YbiA (DUF1768 family)
MSDLMYDDQEFGNAKARWKQYAIHNDKEIKGFFGPMRFLSNFHPVPGKVVYDGVEYPSVECAFQAAKYLPADRKFFETCTGYDAKKRTKTNPPNRMTGAEWDAIKLSIMEDLLWQKFDPVRNPDLHHMMTMLLIGKYLEETNWWHDIFWGVCNGKGENHLGKLLMKICIHHSEAA